MHKQTDECKILKKLNSFFICSLFSFHASQMTIISGSERKCLLDTFLKIVNRIPQRVKRASMHLEECQTLYFDSFKLLS